MVETLKAVFLRGHVFDGGHQIKEAQTELLKRYEPLPPLGRNASGECVEFDVITANVMLGRRSHVCFMQRNGPYSCGASLWWLRQQSCCAEPKNCAVRVCQRLKTDFPGGGARPALLSYDRRMARHELWRVTVSFCAHTCSPLCP